MHRAWRATEASFRGVQAADGLLSLVLVGDDGNITITTSRQPVMDQWSYVASVSKRTGYNVYPMARVPSDDKYAVSAGANKPIAVQQQFLAKRTTVGDAGI